MDLRSRPILIGIICVVAIVLAAATLTTAVDVNGGLGSGDGVGGDIGNDNGGGSDSDPDDRAGGAAGEPLFGDLCVEVTLHPLVTIAVFGGLLAVGLLLWIKTGLLAATAITALIAVPVLLIMALLTAGCADVTPAEETADSVGDAISSLGGNEGLSGNGDGFGVDVTLPTIVLVVGLLLGGAALLLAVRTSSLSSEEDDDLDPADPTELGFSSTDERSLVDPLDEELDPDNPVYQAWAEMAQAVAPDSATPMTPSDYAQVAIDDGLDQESVLELTHQFQVVRYGTATVTEQRKNAATDALQQLAEQHDSIDPRWTQRGPK